MISNDEVLIIPDVHGLDFWKKPCNNWDGIIIFLGDYVDPYLPTTQKEALENLKELVEFSKTTKNTCRFLLGNHDFTYFTDFAPCRFNYKDKDIIKSLLNELNLRLCTYINYEFITYLFSHAGFTNGWLGDCSYIDGEYTLVNGWLDIKSKLAQVPFSRGGDDKYGSCIWNSLEDFETEEHDLHNTYQIFGHTWAGRTGPVITKDYAMLDCHKPFILNIATKEIKEYIVE